MTKNESTYPVRKSHLKAPWLADLEAAQEAKQLEGRRWLGRARKKFRVRADPTVNMKVRKLVHELGYRYILNDERLPGSPHLTFPGRKLALFTVTSLPGLFRDGPPNPSSRSPGERDAWELSAAQKAIGDRGWKCAIICSHDARTTITLTRRVKAILSKLSIKPSDKTTRAR
jgi:G:T-mismatch repair DNA endonuclease (very short patch repair protein)